MAIKTEVLKKYAAEGFGTFALSFAISLSLAGASPVSAPVAAGLALTLLAYTLGPISGAHVNPAVTISIWSIGKMRSSEAAGYVLSQIIGGFAAYFLSHLLILPARIPAANSGWVGIGEAIGAFFLAFGISAVLHERVPANASGAVVGGSLLLGISLASVFSNGILNPAVAIGIGSVSFMYIIAPIVGAVLGMNGYMWLAGGKSAGSQYRLDE